MKCVFCGKVINDDLIFCPYCGRKVVLPETAQTGHIPPEGENKPPYPAASYEPVHSQEQNYSSGYNDDEEDMLYYDDDEYDDYTQDNDDALFYDKKSPMYNGYRSRNHKKQSKANVGLIVLAVVLALAVAGVTCWLLISTLADKSDDTSKEKDNTAVEVYNCSICEKEMTTDKKYCDDCVDEYTCEICGQVSESTENGYCDDCSVEYKCRACNKVDASVNEGYCEDCFSDLKCKGSGCDNVVTSGYYCNTCIKSKVSGSKKCFVCNEKLDDSAIYLIDTNGNPYCKDCDTGRYCTKCSGYLTDSASGDVCSGCITFNCAKCGRTLTESEIVVKDDNNKNYCDNCDTGFYCETCGAPIKNNETKCKNCSEDNN